jgi:hypothetical protein
MPAARPTIGDRVTRSKVPVNGTLAPTGNAPAWVTTLTAAVVAWAAARWGLDETTAALLAAGVGLALGVASQWFTVPASDILESRGPVVRHPDGRLGHRDDR